MDHPPVHNHGTYSLLPHKTVATFPIGTFLENIAVRSDGTILVSDMLAGKIYFLDPNASEPQSTILLIHSFNPENQPVKSITESSDGSDMYAMAIVEDPQTPDIFYTFAGVSGKTGTWAVYKMDLRDFDPSSQSHKVLVKEFARVPDAKWLNGGTMLPEHHTLIIAECLDGQLIACHIPTGKVSVWSDHELLGKIAERPIPGVNGVQFFRGKVFVTNSDRSLFLSADVGKNGEYVECSLKIVADKVGGDDLAFDNEGNAYVATNPVQTVVRLGGVGVGKEVETVTILGGTDVAETAGPTAVAFGRGGKGERQRLYVTTTGGLVKPVAGKVGLARVICVDGRVDGE